MMKIQMKEMFSVNNNKFNLYNKIIMLFYYIMNVFENTVDKIFVINLDKDKERLEYIKNQFKNYGFNDIERIPGILGKNLPDKLIILL